MQHRKRTSSDFQNLSFIFEESSQYPDLGYGASADYCYVKDLRQPRLWPCKSFTPTQIMAV